MFVYRADKMSDWNVNENVWKFEIGTKSDEGEADDVYLCGFYFINLDEARKAAIASFRKEYDCQEELDVICTRKPDYVV